MNNVKTLFSLELEDSECMTKITLSFQTNLDLHPSYIAVIMELFPVGLGKFYVMEPAKFLNKN